MHASGKFALVTGAARGIGRAIATKLLESGAAGVCLVDVDKVQLKSTTDELSLKFPTASVRCFFADLQDKEQNELAFAYAHEQFGKLHIVANNAGICKEDNPELVAAVNFVAVYRGTMLGLKYMRQDESGGGEGGVIINTSSLAGLSVVTTYPVYCATKHAVVAFTRSMAAEQRYSITGVRLNCLCPSLTDTDMAKSMMRHRKTSEYAGLIMKPETVAEAFMQLVADDSAHGKALKAYSADSISYHEFQEEVLPI